MNKKIKVGIIGVGGISNEHIQAYLKNPNVELYAFCDINENQLKKMSEKYGITRCFTDKDEMLKLPEIDAVSVCTWNSAHASCTIAALNAGKHVLCEKPMATSAAEALEMQAAAKRNGKLLMVGFVRRYGNDCTVLKDFISQDYFGDLYYAKATYLRRNGNPGGWFGDKSRSGGGPLIDLGVHVIDLTRYLMGNPKPVSVYGATFQKLLNRPDIKSAKGYHSVSAGENDICDVEDLATAMIRYDNGSVLSIEASFSLNIKKDEGTIQLFGTKGGAKLDPELEMYTEIKHYLADVSLAYPTALSFDGLFANEINHYVDCIINGTECKSPAEDGVTLMRILDAVYESARTGHEVVLDESLNK
ncbi:MAG: Gfo/Idh/MocA family oxidoreductase [Fusicatenibacter sp.]|nr:Gfo/Idh/MocA family oxidoreductase [Lachnospiraceae bacterium]MDY2938985.1 Gfo/Idh/MocA family oxidoreductase [Fusicatenibacter sp.]